MTKTKNVDAPIECDMCGELIQNGENMWTSDKSWIECEDCHEVHELDQFGERYG